MNHEIDNNLQRRMRRLRYNPSIRDMVRENHVRKEDLIYPIFIDEGIEDSFEVGSMPGVFRHSEKGLEKEVKSAYEAGVKSVILFGVSHNKDATGSDSLNDKGLFYRMINRAKNACPEMVVIADLCFCEYTDHGHCGPLDECGDVDNDATLDNLKKQAVIAAKGGADMVAPSGMMDGMVGAIRTALDEGGYYKIPIMSYAVKFASNFYGPFRDAAGCSLGKNNKTVDAKGRDCDLVRGRAEHGRRLRPETHSESEFRYKSNRNTYQLDPANSRQAMIEASIDEAEGADILMVKPGMPYLDILGELRQRTNLPLAVYQVSGEYSMIKHAAIAGAINEQKVVKESLLSFKRAGADMILTYFAKDFCS